MDSLSGSRKSEFQELKRALRKLVTDSKERYFELKVLIASSPASLGQVLDALSLVVSSKDVIKLAGVSPKGYYNITLNSRDDYLKIISLSSLQLANGERVTIEPVTIVGARVLFSDVPLKLVVPEAAESLKEFVGLFGEVVAVNVVSGPKGILTKSVLTIYRVVHSVLRSLKTVPGLPTKISILDEIDPDMYIPDPELESSDATSLSAS
eukprot:TRINITY_DN13693_c0_g1_i1.p1 TRINITY_DN13693_c0_g1~~TRINITY_DN13693_c0_g1_i1.p1  ORF type:complete len:245 (-),score=48.38 TRINITY_DN13693_c0_g1_i1:197-823(-)